MHNSPKGSCIILKRTKDNTCYIIQISNFIRMFYNAPFNASDTRKYISSCNEYNVFTKSLNVLLHSLNNNFSFIFFFYVRAYHHRHRHHHHHLFTASIHPPLVSCNPSCISSCTVLPFPSKFTNYKKSSHQNE